jgi:hypothetical protein
MPIEKGGKDMKKILLAMPIVFAVIFGYAAVTSTACDMMFKSENPSGTVRLLGTAVVNPQGEELGFITDLASDSNEQVAFAVLLYGAYEDYGDGGRLVAVPFGALSCGDQNCALDHTKEQLASAPVFIAKSDLADQNIAENIYRYFGQHPYWTEEESVVIEYEGTQDFPRDFDVY